MSSSWAAAGFLIVLAITAAKRHHQWLALAGLGIHVLALGVPVMLSEEVKCLERLAYDCYDQGNDQECLELCLEIQRRDPGNARRLLLNSLVAERHGQHGAAKALLAEAARLGDGMAISILGGDPNAKPCDCHGKGPK
jgi:hypothetical protein